MTAIPSDLPERTWWPGDSICFRKTREQWGGLSNMAAGFPIRLGATAFRTSEALYQAMRFPSRPDVQLLIAEQASPMAAKMKSKEFRRDFSHPEWDDIRVLVMYWCLELKLAEHWEQFGGLLLATAGHDIVELSHRDRFWGAVQSEDVLVGRNVLGVLLMTLRDELGLGGGPPSVISPPDVGLSFMGEPVPNWYRSGDGSWLETSQVQDQQLRLDL